MIPTPQQIARKRNDAHLTQTVAASMVHSSLRTWQTWESGHARMHPAIWELFNAKLKSSL